MGVDKKALSDANQSASGALNSVARVDESAEQRSVGGERNSMAELERELAELLDDAPLLPDDDNEEESDIDFAPPQGVFQQKAAVADQGASVEPSSETNESAGARPGANEFQPGPASSPHPEASLADSNGVRSVATEASQSPAKRVPALKKAAKGTRASKEATRHKAKHSGPKPKNTSEKQPAKDAGKVDTPTSTAAKALGVGALLLVAAVWYFSQHNPESTAPVPAQASVAAKAQQDLPTTAPTEAGAVPLAPASTLRIDPDGEREPTSQIDTPTHTPSGEQQAPPTTPTSGPADFDAVKVLSALAPAGIQASRCRRTGDPKGKVFVKVVIGHDGKIESVYSGNTYRGTATAECIERKLRAVTLPDTTGASGEVLLPIQLR